VTSRAGGGVTAHVRPDQRYAWCGPSLLVTTLRGECDETEPSSGYYFRETRYRRTLRLRVNGTAPWPCAEGVSSHDAVSVVGVYPELTRFGGGGTDVSDDVTRSDRFGGARRAIDVRLQHRLQPHVLRSTATLANRSAARVRLEPEWEVDADFADLQEAFSGERQQSAPVEVTSQPGGLTLQYRHAQLPLTTEVRADGADWRARDGRLGATVELGPPTRSRRGTRAGSPSWCTPCWDCSRRRRSRSSPSIRCSPPGCPR